MEASVCTLEEPVAPPTAVTSGTSAKQDDDISRIRSLHGSPHCLGAAPITAPISIRLCNIIRMIDFFYIAGSQTDLVSVGAVAVSCAADQSSSAEAFLSVVSFTDTVGSAAPVTRIA